jgi:UDP-glucose 4-epimerase
MGITCLLTGVAGFIGSHLAEQLLALDHRVVGVDDLSTGRLPNMDSFHAHPGFSFHQRSVVEPGLLTELMWRHQGIRVIFHLAAVVSVPYSLSHPDETMAVNYHATLGLLDEASQHGLDAFLFAGSAAEYGADTRLPLREDYADTTTRHLSPYGASKFQASNAVASSLKPRGIALRFFNIYGPRQDPSSPYSGVISRFLELSLRNQAISIFGDGQQTRDFIYVADAVDAYLHAAGLTGKTCPAPVPPGIYNVANGQSTSILELADFIRELTGNHHDPSFAPERPGDIRHSLADIERLQRASDWKPQISLRDGLQRTLVWASKNWERART